MLRNKIQIFRPPSPEGPAHLTFPKSGQKYPDRTAIKFSPHHLEKRTGVFFQMMRTKIYFRARHFSRSSHIPYTAKRPAYNHLIVKTIRLHAKRSYLLYKRTGQKGNNLLHYSNTTRSASTCWRRNIEADSINLSGFSVVRKRQVPPCVQCLSISACRCR